VGDESGSVSSAELVEAIAEVLHICKMLHSPVWYIPVDTQVYTPTLITSSQRSFKRQASGGTTLAPATKAIKDHKIDATSIIVITDGGICESDVEAFRQTGKPIIWLITSQGSLLPSMQSGRMSAYKLASSS
jgi:predicted metal-dependent peptidase